jgi:hypothetical protein
MDATRNLPKKLHEIRLGYAILSHVTLSPVIHEKTDSIFVYPTMRLAKDAAKGNRTVRIEEINVFLATLMLLIGSRMTLSKKAFTTLVHESAPLLEAIGVHVGWPPCENRWITFDCQVDDKMALAKALAPLMSHLNAAQRNQLRNN